MTPGQHAYEHDVEYSPDNPDGSPREKWARLGSLEQWWWEKHCHVIERKAA